jgi:hypothetical protein
VTSQHDRPAAGDGGGDGSGTPVDSRHRSRGFGEVLTDRGDGYDYSPIDKRTTAVLAAAMVEPGMAAASRTP